MCDHVEFFATVNVARMEDTGQFMAHVSIHCEQCGLPFEFQGMEPGIDTQGARVSVDGLEARIAIVPKGARPNPLQRIQFGIKGFDA